MKIAIYLHAEHEFSNIQQEFAMTDKATVVKLKPPIVNSKTVAKLYACMRPGREGGVNISLEGFGLEESSKTIVNCYGHGGAGWSTLFGSVHAALDLFIEKKLDLKTPICVIGAGCVGLTMAIELRRLGYSHVKVLTKELYDLPSWRAPGFLGLLAIDPTPEKLEMMYGLGEKTFHEFEQIEQGNHPYISKECVHLMPIYSTPEEEHEIAFLSERGLTPPKKPVTLDFGNGVIHNGFFEYKTFFMNTGKLMRKLHEEVKRLSIPLEIQEVTLYSQLEEKIVFNCAGFGAEEINHDPHLNAIRGHLVALNSQAGSDHLEYMILSSVKQDGNDETVYMTPKDLLVSSENPEGLQCFGTLGTSFIPHAEMLSEIEIEELDNKEFKKLLDRASLFFSGKPFA